MYLNIKNKKTEIKKYDTFKDRFKSFRFYLEPIDFGIWFPNKKLASTYFFCQRVDICFTDENLKVLAIYNNIKSEKRKFKFKSKNIFYLPVGTCSELKVGDTLNIKE